jgi:hypothetical protein
MDHADGRKGRLTWRGQSDVENDPMRHRTLNQYRDRKRTSEREWTQLTTPTRSHAA